MPSGSASMLVLRLIWVSTKPEALYMVPSPQEQPSAKLTTHLRCGAFLRSSLMATLRLRLSLLRGSASSNAMRLSSMNSFQPVPSTRPIILRLSVLGPKLMTPWSLPPRNAPRWSWELLTTLPL